MAIFRIVAYLSAVVTLVAFIGGILLALARPMASMLAVVEICLNV
jgi:hypothetical protein